MGWLAAAAPIFSGALQAGGSLLGGMMSASGQSATNAQQMAFAQQQAERSREWEENMSNTAYQRAMGDMRQAGLNPMLAANLGGASTPGTSIPSVNLGNPGAAMGAGVTSAGQAAATAATTRAALTQANKDDSQVDLNKASTDYTKSNEALNTELQIKARQDTATSAAQAAGHVASAENARAQARAADAGAALDYSRNVIAGHDANTARERARIAAREADDRERFGPGTWGDASAAANRILQSGVQGAKALGEKAWSGYSENIGQPFAKIVHGVIDKFRQGDGPGLVIDMKNRR